MYAFLHVSLLEEKAVTKPYPNQINLVSFYSSQIKTHGSESRGQEEAGLRDEPVSYLQVAPL